MRLADKIFVVTGAGGGVGRELSLQLLAKGASVAGADLNAAALAETASAAERHGSRFEPFVLDITSQSEVAAFPARVDARFGAADGLINNAGIIQPFTKLDSLEEPTIDRVISVNFLGTLSMLRAFLPVLRARPEAQIVNLSSMGGFVPVPGQTVYCAAKAGVKMLTEGLASELRGTKVHVLLVFPGAIATRIAENSGARTLTNAPNGSSKLKAMSPHLAAEQILRAVEHGRSRLLVGRDAQFMDKLYRMAPGFASARIAEKLKGLLSK